MFVCDLVHTGHSASPRIVSASHKEQRLPDQKHQVWILTQQWALTLNRCRVLYLELIQNVDERLVGEL